MNRFIVMARFQAGTDMADVMAVVAQEQAQVAQLQAEGRLGAIYLATAARQTVFLEILGETEEDAVRAVTSLPMAKWWDLDVFPLNAAAGPRSAE